MKNNRAALQKVERIKIYISVVGAADASAREYELALDVGRAIADARAVLICGGLGGVMEAAAKGARENGGTAIGLLPGLDRADANPHLTAAVTTGLGHGRNYLVVAAGDGVIAIGGGAGTLSEIALALKMNKPTVLLESLDVAAAGLDDRNIMRADSPAEAVAGLLGRL